MESFNKSLHSYALYCRKEMVKILKCYLIPKKSYGTLSKGAIFFGQPCRNFMLTNSIYDFFSFKIALLLRSVGLI